MSQGITGKSEVDGDLVDGTEQSEAIRGSDRWIEHHFIATGSSVGRLQVKHSGMRSGLHFHLEGLVEVIHRLHLWGPGIEGICAIGKHNSQVQTAPIPRIDWLMEKSNDEEVIAGANLD